MPSRTVNNATVQTVTPEYLGGGNVAATASGAAFVPFGAQKCCRAIVFNNTGVTIEVQQGGAGVAVPISTGQNVTFEGVTNMSQLGVRRVDQVATPVTVQARWNL